MWCCHDVVGEIVATANSALCISCTASTLVLSLCVCVCVFGQRFLRRLEEEFGPVVEGRELEAATGADENGNFFDPAYLEVWAHPPQPRVFLPMNPTSSHAYAVIDNHPCSQRTCSTKRRHLSTHLQHDRNGNRCVLLVGLQFVCLFVCLFVFVFVLLLHSTR